MGALAQKIQHAFDNLIRQRGRELYVAGAVHIGTFDAATVRAKVSSDPSYLVSLELRAGGEGLLRVTCSCPFFSDHQQCPHIWATILEADIQRKLQPPPFIAKLSLVSNPGVGGPAPSQAAVVDEDDDDLDDLDPYRSGDLDDDPTLDRRAPTTPLVRRSKDPEWKHFVNLMSRAIAVTAAGPLAAKVGGLAPTTGQTMYSVNVPQTMTGRGVVLELYSRERKKNGDWGVPKARPVERESIDLIADPLDRDVCNLLIGGEAKAGYATYYGRDRHSRFTLNTAVQEAVLPTLAKAGRLFLLTKEYGEHVPLAFDDGAAWDFHLELHTDEKKREYVLKGSLRRGDERKPLSEPVMLNADKWVFWRDQLSRLNDAGAFPLIGSLRQENEIRVPLAQGAEFVAMLQRLPRLPPLDAPVELRVEEAHVVPSACLRIKKPMYDPRNDLRGELSFDYNGIMVLASSVERGVMHPTERKLFVRDVGAENAFAARMMELGFKVTKNSASGEPELNPRHLPRVVAALIADKWRVEADGKLYRTPGEMKMTVSSGIDWFELRAEIDFGGATTTLPALLAALRKGETMVRLDDGSFGLLPEEWLKRYGILAGTGKAHEDHVRFSKTQAGVLDALLAAQPQSTCDETFTRVSEELRSFKSIKAVNPPSGFIGELREYQREGLGWLYFLQRFGFGGCLADDMGLGKTVQVLALLESRRELHVDVPLKKAAVAKAISSDELDVAPKTSLAVVPRSLIFNWKQEAARFAPKLRVLDHTGPFRDKDAEKFDDYDLVLTTYGTLRSDIVFIKDMAFDYVILDEAQIIKNADTGTAKAARLVQGAHRLCMSGTPVENHLNDLWSMFEFLNPGMLGTATVFQTSASAASDSNPEARELLSRALRPFILRRTKAQVAKDLPEKTEQTIHCEMEPEQRKMYNDLRDHYRKSLMGLIERDGINSSKIQILEALLRLRQAACHPGLIDKEKINDPSAKLDALIPQLEEVLEEGHKALVFSQFTSFLSIAKKKLDAANIPYEYLDGKTRDRQAKVDRFQNDPDCKLFLISLKAGGLGLNLTAAEYVFLLDPWWNPAVESQAIDRAHRIGQTQQVFAYRLIVRDSIEEKVVMLQQNKRDLADAIIGAGNSMIGGLKREDLELLLG
ncbi:MAG: DEAD/DEAH box helicase [Planctomycetota bacterium]